VPPGPFANAPPGNPEEGFSILMGQLIPSRGDQAIHRTPRGVPSFNPLPVKSASNTFQPTRPMRVPSRSTILEIGHGDFSIRASKSPGDGFLRQPLARTPRGKRLLDAARLVGFNRTTVPSFIDFPGD